MGHTQVKTPPKITADHLIEDKSAAQWANAKTYYASGQTDFEPLVMHGNDFNLTNKSKLNPNYVFFMTFHSFASDPYDEVILSSREMLEWSDNWDGEGARSYQQKTWKNATEYAVKLRDAAMETGVSMPVPSIMPADKGNIDLHWHTSHYELLISVDEGGKELAYYVDDFDERQLRGAFPVSHIDSVLLAWLADVETQG